MSGEAPKPKEFLVYEKDDLNETEHTFRHISLVRQDATGLCRVLDNAVDRDLFRAQNPMFREALFKGHKRMQWEEQRFLYDDSDAPRLIYPSDRNEVEVYVDARRDVRDAGNDLGIIAYRGHVEAMYGAWSKHDGGEQLRGIRLVIAKLRPGEQQKDERKKRQLQSVLLVDLQCQQTEDTGVARGIAQLWLPPRGERPPVVSDLTAAGSFDSHPEALLFGGEAGKKLSSMSDRRAAAADFSGAESSSRGSFAQRRRSDGNDSDEGKGWHQQEVCKVYSLLLRRREVKLPPDDASLPNQEQSIDATQQALDNVGLISALLSSVAIGTYFVVSLNQTAYDGSEFGSFLQEHLVTSFLVLNSVALFSSLAAIIVVGMTPLLVARRKAQLHRQAQSARRSPTRWEYLRLAPMLADWRCQILLCMDRSLLWSLCFMLTSILSFSAAAALVGFNQLAANELAMWVFPASAIFFGLVLCIWLLHSIHCLDPQLFPSLAASANSSWRAARDRLKSKLPAPRSLPVPPAPPSLDKSADEDPV